MKIINTAIEGVYIIEPQVFEDNRGYFFESYNKQKMDEAGLKYDFIQDNQSMSKYGTIRGIHFQKGDFAQAKLVRVLEGTVLDVAVDLRKGSKTFGKHVAVELSAENKRQLMIPRGFGHGFRYCPKRPSSRISVTTFITKLRKAAFALTIRTSTLTGRSDRKTPFFRTRIKMHRF